MLSHRPRAAVIAVVVGCAAILLPRAARADEQLAFSCPKPGTVIEFTDGGGTITFGAPEGMWCVGTDERGQSFRRYAMLAGPNATWASFIENHVERIWPLQLGKEISFTHKGSASNQAGGISADTPFWYTDRITVARKERLTVEAGTFDTWVIEDHQDVARGGGAALRTYWYAPEIGFAIKYTYHIALGVGKDIAFEAKRIEVPR
jgi:hypothetical protein